MAIAVPLLGGNKATPTRLHPQRTTSVSGLVQGSPTYAEFYSGVRYVTPVVAPSPGKMLAGRLGDDTDDRLADTRTVDGVHRPDNFVPRSSVVSRVPGNPMRSRATPSVDSRDPFSGRPVTNSPAATPNNGAMPAEALAERALNRRPGYLPQSTSRYRSGVAGTRVTQPPGAVYAPITVHPVTANVDGGIFADQLATMTKRLEELLESKDAGKQESALPPVVSEIRKTPPTGQGDMKPAVGIAQTQQLIQLNQRLHQISESFERFQDQTQRTVNEISMGGRRTEIAFEEIRLAQRKLESKIEQARMTESSHAGVVHLPSTPQATVPSIPESVSSSAELPLTDGASASTSVPSASRREISPPSIPSFSRFELPSGAAEEDPFSTAQAELSENVGELPASPTGPTSFSVEFGTNEHAASTTDREPQQTSPKHRLFNSDESSGVALPKSVMEQWRDSGDAFRNHEISPQTNIDRTHSAGDNSQTALLLAYKARRLMREAEEALESGNAALASSRALQARSIAKSESSLKERTVNPSMDSEPVDGLLPLPPVDDAQTVNSVQDDVQDSDYDHHRAIRIVEQARASIAAGKLREAMKMADQAEALDSSYGPSEDSPSRVREDIAWLAGVRTPSAIVNRTADERQPSKRAETSSVRDSVKVARRVEETPGAEVTPLIDRSDPPERNVVKRVAFEHVYSFDLADIEPESKSGTGTERSLDGVPCKQCGKIHPGGASVQHESESDVEPAGPEVRRKLFAPNEARRSNRRQRDETDETGESGGNDGIWGEPAFPRLDKQPDQSEPSTFHRLSSAIRRIGRPAIE